MDHVSPETTSLVWDDKQSPIWEIVLDHRHGILTNPSLRTSVCLNPLRILLPNDHFQPHLTMSFSYSKESMISRCPTKESWALSLAVRICHDPIRGVVSLPMHQPWHTLPVSFFLTLRKQIIIRQTKGESWLLCMHITRYCYCLVHRPFFKGCWQ